MDEETALYPFCPICRPHLSPSSVTHFSSGRRVPGRRFSLMRTTIPVLVTVSLAYLHCLEDKRNSARSRTLIVVFAMFCAFCGVAPTPAYAQSPYTDPSGVF